MPKNQFQRPLPIQHHGNVPRHGKQQPAFVKPGAGLARKAPPAGLPPLATLLDPSPRK